jgi:hypothetical protein
MKKDVINKAMGAILMPYSRIGGHLTFPPPLIARAQVDGSFGRSGGSRIAAILTSDTGDAAFRSTRPIKALNSTETEWAAVALGLELALQHNQTAIGIENDCLGVIQGLIFPTELKHAYARHWRSQILNLAAETHWTGVRWIPREVNGADALLR